MRVFYNSSNTNFGDHINSWLWRRLAPQLFEVDDDRVLVGIGSLLKSDLERVPGKKLIFGTGSGYGRPASENVSRDWAVYAVRGPLTAAQFGFSPATAVTDGAWLIDRLAEFRSRRDRDGRILFIPHWTSAAMGDWDKVSRLCGIEYVNPLGDFSGIINRISSADLVITESLHGAIFADYYRTPWIPVSSAVRILPFKWIDWCQSLELEYRPVHLPPSDYVDFFLQGRLPSSEIGAYDESLLLTGTELGSAITSTPRKSRIYAYRQLARRGARAVKDHALSYLARNREFGPICAWNERYQSRLVSYLETVKTGRRYLSSDRVRDSRLDQLNEIFEDFLRDQR